MIKKRVFTGLKHLLLILLSFIAVFPIYWMIISSLKGDPEIFNYLPFSKTLMFKNYQYAFQAMPIAKMLVNSLVNSAVQTVCQLVVAVLAAYGLVRWDFPGKTIVYSLFTLTWLVPFQAIMIPNYVQINEWGLNGTVTAIILPYMASSFACISMYQAFASFPKALIDAGRMDGSGELQVLKNIVLPSMGASVASLGIILFINSWNDYMWPMLVTKKLEQAPIQIGLKSFVGADVNMWGSMMAATTVSCLPILIIYLVLQRNIVDSFMKWGIK